MSVHIIDYLDANSREALWRLVEYLKTATEYIGKYGKQGESPSKKTFVAQRLYQPMSAKKLIESLEVKNYKPKTEKVFDLIPPPRAGRDNSAKKYDSPLSARKFAQTPQGDPRSLNASRSITPRKDNRTQDEVARNLIELENDLSRTRLQLAEVRAEKGRLELDTMKTTQYYQTQAMKRTESRWMDEEFRRSQLWKNAKSRAEREKKFAEAEWRKIEADERRRAKKSLAHFFEKEGDDVKYRMAEERKWSNYNERAEKELKRSLIAFRQDTLQAARKLRVEHERKLLFDENVERTYEWQEQTSFRLSFEIEKLENEKKNVRHQIEIIQARRDKSALK